MPSKEANELAKKANELANGFRHSLEKMIKLANNQYVTRENLRIAPPSDAIGRPARF